MSVQIATLRNTAPTETSDLLRQILAAIQGVRYDQVQIIVQDSCVVQIDKTEKLRLV